MGNVCFGHTNRVTAGTLAAGSEAADLGIGNLATPHGAPATAWQTAAGVVTSAAGAWFTLDAGSSAATWRAFLLARTNLTSAATVRWRVGPAEACLEVAPAVTLDFTAPGTWAAPSGWAYTRAGSATRVNAAGLVETLGANAMRWDYDPVTLALRGLLNETAKTNLLLQSAGFDQAAWTKAGAAATANAATGPDGAASAEKLAEDTSTGAHECAQAVSATAAAHTLSVWVKAAERSTVRLVIDGTVGGAASSAACTFDLAAGSAGTPAASGNLSAVSAKVPEAFPGGWWRIGLTATLSAAATVTCRVGLVGAGGVASYAGTSGSGALLWGAQMEQADYPTSYIPTTTATVARAADSWTVALDSATQATIAASGATLYLEGLTLSGKLRETSGGGTEVGSVRLDDSVTVTNYLQIRTVGVTTGTYHDARSLTANVVQFDGTNFTAGAKDAVHRLAASAAAASFYSAANGVGGAAVATGTWPGTINRLRNFAGERSWHARVIRLYAGRLTNGQTLALSAAGSTLDATAATYDSGTVAAGVVAGFRQSVVVAAATATGRYCRCDINDATNPDQCINIPLAYAGPVWQPGKNFGYQTQMQPEAAVDLAVTRGGQQYANARYWRRALQLTMPLVATADLWTGLDALLRVGDADNVLCVPNPDSADIGREAVFGLLAEPGAVAYSGGAGRWRRWQGRISERL